MNYQALVNKRKTFSVNYDGFINQSQIESGIYDKGPYLEPWAQWYNSIPADILVVGQDWGGIDYYIKNKGKDVLSNSTCYNLIELFKQVLPIEIGAPNNPSKNLKLHFTNIIPFIRTGEMQGNKNNIINNQIVKECANEFLKPLIEIVNPTTIITLGSFAFKALSGICALTTENQSFTKLVDNSPLKTSTGIKVFPMFHCGALGVNLNRKLDKQKEDWKKVSLTLPQTL